MPSCAAIGCVNSSGKNPSLSIHQILLNKRRKIRQEWLRCIKFGQNENIFQRIQNYASAQRILRKIVLKEICK